MIRLWQLTAQETTQKYSAIFIKLSLLFNNYIFFVWFNQQQEFEIELLEQSTPRGAQKRNYELREHEL